MNVVTRTRRFIFVVSAFLPERNNATTKANLLHHGVGIDGAVCRCTSMRTSRLRAPGPPLSTEAPLPRSQLTAPSPNQDVRPAAWQRRTRLAHFDHIRSLATDSFYCLSRIAAFGVLLSDFPANVELTKLQDDLQTAL